MPPKSAASATIRTFSPPVFPQALLIAHAHSAAFAIPPLEYSSYTRAPALLACGACKVKYPALLACGGGTEAIALARWMEPTRCGNSDDFAGSTYNVPRCSATNAADQRPVTLHLVSMTPTACAPTESSRGGAGLKSLDESVIDLSGVFNKSSALGTGELIASEFWFFDVLPGVRTAPVAKSVRFASRDGVRGSAEVADSRT
eukprot:scaffold267695_cov30-Tisochrysis_lutea.AAC.3